MKKLLMAFMLVISLVTSTAVFAASSPKVLLNNTEMNFPNKPIIIDGTTMVPFRNLLESLNASVNYDAKTKTITTSTDNVTIKLVLGEKIAVKNGELMQLAVAPYVNNGVTYVPLRFLSQSFGYTVDFKSNTISIATAGGTSTTPTTTAKDESRTSATLSVEEIGKLENRVAYIETFDHFCDLFATGSGVVLEANGGILTNYHVIEGATSAIVYLGNTKYETTTVLKQDIERDLALLKINATQLPSVKIGDSSKVVIGESIVAIGSPLGFSNSLSTGNISNVSRKLDNLTFIQITAPIDHGSSGGALFNMKGELIGITTAKIESSANLNFAIPSVDVVAFMNKPSQATEMVGYNGYGENSLIEQTEDDLYYFLYDEMTYFYNDNLGFEVDWYVDYFEDYDQYFIFASLSDYKEYEKLYYDIANEDFDMQDLYIHIMKKIEANVGVTNIFLGFAIETETNIKPNYKLVSEEDVSYHNGTYWISYMFSGAERYDNTLYFVSHELIDNTEYYVDIY